MPQVASRRLIERGSSRGSNRGQTVGCRREAEIAALGESRVQRVARGVWRTNVSGRRHSELSFELNMMSAALP
jgi:hypothetical protein